MSTRSLKFEIIIDGKRAVAEIQNFAQVVKQATQQVDAELKKSRSAFSSIANIGEKLFFTFQGFRAAAQPLKSLVEASNRQEQAVRAVEVAMRQQGSQSDVLIEKVKNLTAELQRKTIYGDEATMEAMARAMNTGADYAKVIENISLIQDIASATGRDLGTIAEYVGRAMQGQTDMLARYVPAIRNLNDEQRTWENVQKILIFQFEGMAEKMAQTEAGAMQQFANSWGDLKEKIGDAIKSGLVPIINALRGLVEWLTSLPPVVNQFGIALIGVVGTLRILSSILAGFSVSIGPGGWFIAGLGLLATVFGMVATSTSGATAELNRFRAEIAGLQVDELNQKLFELQEQETQLMEEMGKAPGIWELFKQAVINGKTGVEAGNAAFEEQTRKLEILNEKQKLVKERIEELNKVRVEQARIAQQASEQEIQAAIKAGEEWQKQIEQRIEATRKGKDAEIQMILQKEYEKIDYMAETGRISNEQYLEILNQRLKYVKEIYGEESLEFMKLQDKIKEIANQTSETFREQTQEIKSSFDAAFGSLESNITDFEESGAKKWDRIWADIERIFVRAQLNMLKSLIFAEKTKQAVKKQSTGIMVGEYLKEAATAVGSAIKTIAATLAKAGSFIASAAAKIYESFASIPFGLGIPIAAGIVAGLVATFNTIKSKLTAFAEGGLIERPTLGLIGETGEVEIVTPEKDALTVLREMAAMVLEDVRSVIMEKQIVEVGLVGAGRSESQDILLEIRDILGTLQEKDVRVTGELRARGRDLYVLVRNEEKIDQREQL